jgi:hypothetical protein
MRVLGSRRGQDDGRGRTTNDRGSDQTNARASDGVAVTLGDRVGRVSYAVAFFVSAEPFDCLVDAIASFTFGSAAG